MKISVCATGLLACAAAAAVPTSAGATIVKAPTGESARLSVLTSVTKSLKKKNVSVVRAGRTTGTAASFTVPYSLARWDFEAREGDVAYFARGTGIRFALGRGRSIAMTHPRVVADGPRGYITGLISNVRVKTFTFSMAGAKVTNTGGVQRISGLRLKLTKASAQYINKGLRRTVLKPYTPFGTLELRIRRPAGGGGAPATGAPAAGGPGTAAPAGGGTAGGVVTGAAAGADVPGQGDNPGGTVSFSPTILSQLPGGVTLAGLAPGIAADLDGDGVSDAGTVALPLKSSTFDATTRTGTIKLEGGAAVSVGGRELVGLRDPEIVIGATPASSGVYVLVDGVRVKLGDIDTRSLRVGVLDGTVTLSDLDVTAAADGIPILGPLLGQVLGTGLTAGSPLLKLDLSLPQL